MFSTIQYLWILFALCLTPHFQKSTDTPHLPCGLFGTVHALLCWLCLIGQAVSSPQGVSSSIMMGTALPAIEISHMTALRKIGDQTFYYCTSLTSANFSNLSHVEELGDNFMTGCTALSDISKEQVASLHRRCAENRSRR